MDVRHEEDEETGDADDLDEEEQRMRADIPLHRLENVEEVTKEVCDFFHFF